MNLGSQNPTWRPEFGCLLFILFLFGLGWFVSLLLVSKELRKILMMLKFLFAVHFGQHVVHKLHCSLAGQTSFVAVDPDSDPNHTNG